MPAVPKPKFKKKPKNSNDFSAKERAKIRHRSGGTCEWCGKQEAVHQHHIKFRSQGGQSVHTNGIDLCLECHVLPHTYRIARRAMEDWAIVRYGENYHREDDRVESRCNAKLRESNS